ncbi:ribonuclease H [Trifolium pratense]|uniref:Ribonuclease H n=1 Tax=Trifolium pratense TaxID=57577 RepID=A0A2K3MPR8_TRIPR|nr:ribonuclease H [Trifolium pratense]
MCPNKGTVCLNVDGSMSGSTQSAGFGGLIRNNFGAFLKHFYGERLPKYIACYSDSLQTVALIRDGVSPFHKFANEIQSIRHMLSREWNVVIEHTFREGHACADVLAKMGASATSPLVVLEEPPVRLLSARRE